MTITKSSKTCMAAIAGGAACGLIALAVLADHPRHGYAPRPHNTEATTANVAPDTIHLHKSANFEGDMASIDNVTRNSHAQPADLPKDLEDSLSAMRWNLPPGVIVILYEDDAGKGEQLTLWGSGQSPAITKWDFNDKATTWAWFYVGGVDSPPAHYPKTLSAPLDVEMSSAGVPNDTLQLFKDKNYEGNTAAVSAVTAQPAGKLNALPQDLPDSMTSLRWNLPPGVVVVFYQDAGGLKQQATVWGAGQIDDVDVWDFNDKVSRWAWYFVGDPPGSGPATPPTAVKPDRPVEPKPARPAPPPATDAPSGWVQLWDEPKFTGRTITVRSPVDSADFTALTTDDGIKGFSDKTASVRWHIPEGWKVVLYDGPNYSQTKLELLGTGEVEENADLGLFADKASSLRWERKP